LVTEAAALENFVVDENDIAQDRKQMFLDAANHLAVDESGSWSIVHRELHTPGLLQDLDFEITVAVEDLLGVVGVGPAVQDSQGALAEQGIQAPLARVQELADFRLGEILETAARADPSIDEFREYRAVHAKAA
jgi:hypothetical protein